MRKKERDREKERGRKKDRKSQLKNDNNKFSDLFYITFIEEKERR